MSAYKYIYMQDMYMFSFLPYYTLGIMYVYIQIHVDNMQCYCYSNYRISSIVVICIITYGYDSKYIYMHRWLNSSYYRLPVTRIWTVSPNKWRLALVDGVVEGFGVCDRDAGNLADPLLPIIQIQFLSMNLLNQKTQPVERTNSLKHCLAFGR